MILSIIFAVTPTDGSRHRVIDSSIVQKIFSSVSKFLSCNKGKRLELRKDKKVTNINNILRISKLCVMRLTQNKKNQ